VLSGDTRDESLPRFLWSGNSRNHVPEAKLHPVFLSASQRTAIAEAELNELLAEIKAAFDPLLQQSFLLELKQHIRVESFSSEVDELHQLVDCVVLGPYSAADLNTSLHLDNVYKIPVQQYHRGSTTLQQFSTWGETGGSSARKSLMQNVFDTVNAQAEDIVTQRTGVHLFRLAQVWLDRANFKCLCSDGNRAFQCCKYDSDNGFVLQTIPVDRFDIKDSIRAETFSRIINSKFLQERLWTQHAGSSIPLEQKHRSALHTAHLFAEAGQRPVRAYSVEDTATALNKASLWETCTSRVSGLFASLPFTDTALNKEQGRDSKVHVRTNAFETFDTSIDTTASTAWKFLSKYFWIVCAPSCSTSGHTPTGTSPRTVCGARAQTGPSLSLLSPRHSRSSRSTACGQSQCWHRATINFYTQQTCSWPARVAGQRKRAHATSLPRSVYKAIKC
jgi:hypothetical protein